MNRILIFLISCILSCFAEGNSRLEFQKYALNHKKKEFNISFFTGFYFFGPAADIKNRMEDVGLDDISYGTFSLFGIPSKDRLEYPLTRKIPIFSIDGTYFIDKRKGVSINAGIIDNVDVTGLEGLTYMDLRSLIGMIGVSFTQRLKNIQTKYFLGPCILWHHVTDNSLYSVSPDRSIKNIRPGLKLGGSHEVFNKGKFFMRIQIAYRWSPKSQIGPYVVEDEIGILSSNPETLTITFPRTEVSLQGINLGVSLGFRNTRIHLY